MDWSSMEFGKDACTIQLRSIQQDLLGSSNMEYLIVLKRGIDNSSEVILGRHTLCKEGEFISSENSILTFNFSTEILHLKDRESRYGTSILLREGQVFTEPCESSIYVQPYNHSALFEFRKVAGSSRHLRTGTIRNRKHGVTVDAATHPISLQPTGSNWLMRGGQQQLPVPQHLLRKNQFSICNPQEHSIQRRAQTAFKNNYVSKQSDVPTIVNLKHRGGEEDSPYQFLRSYCKMRPGFEDDQQSKRNKARTIFQSMQENCTTLIGDSNRMVVRT